MEWIVGIIVFVFVVSYFVGSSENKKSEASKQNKIFDDSGFDEKNYHFENFKLAQI